jgi:protocatechuate 3,4-dioxygenase beta subunit|tara:strand:+ start:416 stop:997 length:582 start_codon:yes stop_codon:yes gene_type:complete
MKRRAFLLLPLLTVVSQRLLAFLKPTPMDLEGPFYPEVPIPIRNNLVKHASGVARGQHLALTGRVTDLSGNPQAAVLVEIWQCDSTGRYRHPRARGSENVDPHFAGFGACKTGPQGKYDFTTLVPVPYAGRPPHIHVKIVQGHREMLTSQLYLKDGIADGGGSWNIANRAELVIDPKEISVDHFQAEFDFVIS